MSALSQAHGALSARLLAARGVETGPLARFERMLAALESFPAGALQLMARVAVGAVFFKSGLAKIASWDTTLLLFAEEYKVPLLSPGFAATLATATELACPVFLFLGLGARFAALPLLVMTFVIQAFVYPENWAEHLTWATLLLLVVARGAGSLSLDRLLRRRVLDDA